MRQEIISYLSSIKEEIFKLSDYIYSNPEKSFHEYKSYNYILAFLKKYDFDIESNFLNIPTSFIAKYGNGHPKICYLCEYDANPNKGHIEGHNIVSSISIASALALAKVIPKIGGSVILIGCPGELIGGSKITMAKQGAFKDIDAVLMAHPHCLTAESGTSMALLPMSITFINDNCNNEISTSFYSALDACFFTFNALNLLIRSFGENCTINGVNVEGGSTPNSIPSKVEAKFYIKAPSMKIAENIETKIKKFITAINNLLCITSEFHIYDLPCEELISSKTLSRLFSHNLKEMGIIDIYPPNNLLSSLSIGNLSHIVPCIQAYISITNDSSINYKSYSFAKATTTEFAMNRIIETAEALALTGLDLIEKETLLIEAKKELYCNINNKQ